LHFFLTFRFRMHMLHAALQWSNEAIEQLRNWQENPRVRQTAGA
jgi:hypothetical protein